MNILGKECSEKLVALWNEISEPKPSVKELPSVAAGMDPRFAGQHTHDAANGDVVLAVPGGAHEYTIAHELMHVILRREDYPHFTYRSLGLAADTVKRTAEQLESAAIHPVLNHRLASVGITLPPEHVASYVQKSEATIQNDRAFIEKLPDELPYWALLLTEMTMWHVIPQEELRKRLDLPPAWELADQLLPIASGLERGTPERCREFAVQAVKAIDECRSRQDCPAT
jgi:hypothetical protein